MGRDGVDGSTDASLDATMKPICPDGYVGIVVYPYRTLGKILRHSPTTLPMRSRCSHRHSPWVHTTPPGAKAFFMERKKSGWKRASAGPTGSDESQIMTS